MLTVGFPLKSSKTAWTREAGGWPATQPAGTRRADRQLVRTGLRPCGAGGGLTKVRSRQAESVSRAVGFCRGSGLPTSENTGKGAAGPEEPQASEGGGMDHIGQAVFY